LFLCWPSGLSTDGWPWEQPDAGGQSESLLVGGDLLDAQRVPMRPADGRDSLLRMLSFEYLILSPDRGGENYTVVEPNPPGGAWRQVPASDRYVTLNELGRAGWELVALKGPEYGIPEFYFKRQIS